ncbi:beta-glucosidase [Bifidobacterium goeldii]|uniref:beta-N-acetylhexosaminidase n=1 Tax=Bifidobacterium goeldii TaxID=2306975 RepID=A0A430FML0_9BIFI|nr:glycoside hydrolase family 3 N-terminal domain-containing protein [Bifidobacterium goeldii]RSX54030.1 beta-glucosidase [Bifidobacterium goeldii]
MKQKKIRHGRVRATRTSWPFVVLAAVVAVALVVSLTAWWTTNRGLKSQTGSQTVAQQDTSSSTSDDASTSSDAQQDLDRQSVPQSTDDSPSSKAQRAVASMSLEEQAGQLIMAPLYAGTDASALRSLITDQHVGSVLIIGNWRSGVSGVKQATDALQGYAPDANKLLMATDQEGGQVQHLKGAGFDTMPSAVQQGQMTADQLRSSAAVWGGQLKAAGINVDLAPVLGTVQVQRSSNAPIGALNRDFGLDANGNAQHGTAFVEGMRDAGVETSVKHYPGLGAVTGNTDFTDQGILDTTTTLDGQEIGAFNQTITQAKPAMVMMSLATYQAIDPSAPAAFSSTIIDGHLRASTGYDGVVISDSLSAAAVSGIATSQLGVRLVEAGGDLACIGDNSYVQPILNGLIAKAQTDPTFAQKVTRSATRVMTLKYQMGLAQ